MKFSFLPVLLLAVNLPSKPANYDPVQVVK